jgi:hypothetical protein
MLLRRLIYTNLFSVLFRDRYAKFYSNWSLFDEVLARKQSCLVCLWTRFILLGLSAVGAKCGDVRPLHQGHLAKLQYKPVDKKTDTDQDLVEDLEVLDLEETEEVQEGIVTKETSDVYSEYSAMYWCSAPSQSLLVMCSHYGIVHVI